MKVRFKITPTDAPAIFMRRAGYALKINRKNEVSFVRRAAGEEFPRFHVYVQTGDATTFSLHLDMKEHTWGEAHRHSGEYDGTLLRREVERISASLRTPLLVLVKDTKTA